MKRDRYKPVTTRESFAVLVSASPTEAKGEATFLGEFGPTRLVRPVALNELKKLGPLMKGAAGAHFFAVLALRGALEANDDLQLAKAKERLEHAYQMREIEDPDDASADSDLDRELGEMLASRTGMSPEDSIKHFAGLRSGPRARNDPFRLLSYEVSESVGLFKAEIVLWWADQQFRPAIFCDNKITALYVHTFFIAPIGAPGWRSCPHCGEQFFQDRPNQEYCRPAHREAHRVARWRVQQKLKATTKREE